MTSDREQTVLLRHAPKISGRNIAELLKLVRDRRIRFVRVDGEVFLYVSELQELQHS